jgi:hypothetical protein
MAIQIQLRPSGLDFAYSSSVGISSQNSRRSMQGMDSIIAEQQQTMKDMQQQNAIFQNLSMRSTIEKNKHDGIMSVIRNMKVA